MKKQDIFILSLFQHGDKARYSTLAHLLRGKRTASVLMYGFLYDLLPYFALMPKLSEAQLGQIIRGLLQETLLSESQPGVVAISQQGRERLRAEPVINHDGLDSLSYSRVDDQFAELLLFGTQVVSEYCHGHKAYQPLERSQLKQAVIKGWLRQLPEKRQLGQAFFEEWQQLINSLPKGYRPFVVLYLSGHQQIGQTINQLAELAQVSLFEASLIKKQLIHLAIRRILAEPANFPLMNGLYQCLGKPLVNESALKTYHLFQQGWHVAALSEKRRLKISTVSEHLIEAAITDEAFDFSPIVTEPVRAILTPLLATSSLRQLRYSQLGSESEQVSFLAFRCFQIQQIRGGH